jgi:hypothetical protein
MGSNLDFTNFHFRCFSIFILDCRFPPLFLVKNGVHRTILYFTNFRFRCQFQEDEDEDDEDDEDEGDEDDDDGKFEFPAILSGF